MTDLPTLSGPTVAPANGAKPTSLVILLHGYGSNGDDLIGLVPYWRQALPNTLFVSPNAPQPLPGSVGGYQWWALDSLAPAARAAGVRVSAAALNAFIDQQLAATGLSEDKLALVGFSQGTMMALHVGPRRKKQIAAIVGYSGMLADPDALAAEVKTKPPVFLAHGDSDQVLPVASLHDAERRLKVLGFEVGSHVSRGLAHSIDDAGLQLGGRFLVDKLA